MNKKVITGILMFLAVVPIAVLALLNRMSGPVLRGRLAQTDQREVIRLVRRAVWRQSFPDFSWHTVRMAPWSLYRIAGLRIPEIVAPGRATEIQVTAAFGRAAGSERFWLLVRDTKGWIIEAEESQPFIQIIQEPARSWTIRRPGPQAQSSSLLSPIFRQAVPALFVGPDSTGPKPPPRSLDGGEEFSDWLSNHARLSIDGRR